MFRIPDYYTMEMTFAVARDIMIRYGNNDLLAGMQKMNDRWTEYLTEESGFTDDDDWYCTYQHEVNAYNTVFKQMGKLFEPA